MAAKSKDEAEYAPPTSQVDLERRLANDNRSDRVLLTSDSYVPAEGDEGRSFAVEGNDLSEYVGTNPEYMTYANETEAPLASEGGPEAEVFDFFAEATEPVGSGDKADTEDENPPEDDTPKSSSESPSTSG